MERKGGASQRIPRTAVNESWKPMLKRDMGSMARTMKAASARVDQMSFSLSRRMEPKKTRAMIMALWQEICNPAREAYRITGMQVKTAAAFRTLIARVSR